jgi:putative MATE family efflux protein
MTSDLTTAPIATLIRRMAIPAGTGFFFNTMFNVVDVWYGGKLSTTALAAMSLSFPVFFILLAIGTGVSTGSTALIGNALGRGEKGAARTYVLQSFSFGLIHALALSAIGLLLLPAIFRFMGAQGEYLSLALSYMNVIFAGAAFFMLNFVMSAILNAHGNTISYRNFLVSGFFLNLALDPWFMYGGWGVPAMGLSGIAFATILVQCIGNFYLYSQLYRTGTLERFTLKELRPRWRYFKELFGQGFPAAVNMMTVSLGIFIITWYVGTFGQEAVAAYGIATRIEQLALLPAMGLNVSTLALTAQNFGAGRIDRIRYVLAVSLRYGFILAVSGGIAALVFTAELMNFFTKDTTVVAIGIRFLRIEAFVFPAYVLLYICISAMQGIKRPIFGLWIGLYRQIAGPFLIFHIYSTVLAMGITGVWWGIFTVTWSAAIIVVVYVSWILKKLQKDVISL